MGCPIDVARQATNFKIAKGELGPSYLSYISCPPLFLFIVSHSTPVANCCTVLSSRLEWLLSEASVESLTFFLSVLALTKAFVRGGMQGKTGDTPERKGCLGYKGANHLTRCPCSLCKATQSNVPGDVGGEIGNRDYDIVKNRRTRGELEEGRRQLAELGRGTKAAQDLSTKLGILEPNNRNEPRVLYDLCSFHNPMLACSSEVLHLNDLVRFPSSLIRKLEVRLLLLLFCVCRAC